MILSRLLVFAFAATPLSMWLLNVFMFRRRIYPIILFTLAFLIGYVVLLMAVAALDAELDYELHRHDINGDGALSGEELTAEAERAMDAVTSDTGRNFAAVTGIPITFLWTTLNFTVIGVVDWLARAVIGLVSRYPRTKKVATVPANEITPDTGNPYQPPRER
jgi:hypothetical protein